MARIQNNLMAGNTHRQYSINNANAAASAEKLSSGYKINRAGDDAAGLAISEKMRAQVRGLNMASKNSQDAISLIQTAEGALQETHSMLQRMNELATQAASDTNVDGTDRDALNSEFAQLLSEIGDIATQTTFNTKSLIDGNAGTISIQIGVNNADVLAFTLGTMTAAGLTIDALDISTSGGASEAIGADSDAGVRGAINAVSTERAKLGALQNRLQHKINNLDISSENLTAAESRIRDIDMAKEMSIFNKNNILGQAATAMLAQANSAPQNVLQLLR